ncbi:DUF2911 domain-containing protein [Tenacibaculum finnmarkense]|uniref:DUF2911 domain-containing protein n=1 Tax=Tenacibaculum finnmarkense TaxID=2781243 RepID=UPI001E5650D3|nr:DUF2911 domain-containing protein [Tenacibaculum finnmarkense]MCD8408674.1 DUF2911 domain-containing protein [Tenacibaculum finnmarkense genomovar ulcerans]
MKKIIFVTVVLILTVLFSNQVTAQSFAGLDKSPMDVAAYPSSYRISDKLVKVVYSRPQLRRRTVSKLAPNKKVWRTGANEATEITFYKDVNFGGKEVKAGTYTLFTIPGNKEWTIILSTAKNVWGAYSYNETEDVVRVSASVSTSKKSIEAFSIAFNGQENDATMYLGWGKVIVSVPVKG